MEEVEEGEEREEREEGVIMNDEGRGKGWFKHGFNTTSRLKYKGDENKPRRGSIKFWNNTFKFNSTLRFIHQVNFEA